tara:strand:- start:188 stop:460 length:273 start_codon:yes stop_codon:yes gene_type:complete
VDNVLKPSFYTKRDGNLSGDWGFKIKLPEAYFITRLILDGRNDCCTDRIVNTKIKLYRCGSLKYTSLSRPKNKKGFAVFEKKLTKKRVVT